MDGNVARFPGRLVPMPVIGTNHADHVADVGGVSLGTVDFDGLVGGNAMQAGGGRCILERTFFRRLFSDLASDRCSIGVGLAQEFSG